MKLLNEILIQRFQTNNDQIEIIKLAVCRQVICLSSVVAIVNHGCQCLIYNNKNRQLKHHPELPTKSQKSWEKAAVDYWFDIHIRNKILNNL